MTSREVSLKVTVVRANIVGDYGVADPPDAYVNVRVDRARGLPLLAGTTSVKSNNNNPEWNEDFLFELSSDDGDNAFQVRRAELASDSPELLVVGQCEM